MTFLPLVVTTSLPSMVIFTGSIGEAWSDGVLEKRSIAFHPSLHYSNTPLPHFSVSYRASFLRDMGFELVAIFFDERPRRHRRGIAERADRVAHDVAANVEDQIEIFLLAFAMLDAVKNFFHPVAAFPAWTALAAGLVGEKALDVPRCAHHAGRFAHYDDAAGTEEAARRLH